MNDRDYQVVRQAAAFSALDDEALGEILADANIKTWTRGETIFLQGEKALSFFVTLEGWAKVYRITPAGEEAVLGVFTSGQSFAEAAAFTGGKYPASAEAASDARLLVLSARHMKERIHASPDLGLAMLASTSQHLHRLVLQIEALKAHTGAQRVAEFLLTLCDDDQSGACVLSLPYDKALIAGRLGMKPESLSRAFVKLRGQGVRILQNKAEISDLDKLREFVDEERATVMRQGSH